MLRIFRILGWCEGVSLLLLLGVAMPLKYQYAMPLMTTVVGAAHGILFLAYNICASSYGQSVGWTLQRLGVAFALSCIPFGTFIFDRRYLSDSAQSAEI